MRNLIRRFVEAGVPGYHIEDQRPGTKKCGHQGGKVLVPSDEQIKRLNTARFQLDIMRVPGIIVARTDAEAANLLDSRADERDQPFLLGTTNLKIPSYKSCFLAMVRRFYELGVKELNGHLLYALPDGEYAAADAWLERHGIADAIAEAAASLAGRTEQSIDALFDEVESKFVDAWQVDAGLMTYGEAVAELLEFVPDDGESRDMSADEWRKFAARASLYTARKKAKELGADVGVGLRAGQDARGLLPDPRRHPLRDRQIACRSAFRRPALDGDQDRGPGRRPANSPRRSTPSSPTRCWPTTSRRRSTGTPPA